MTPKSHVVSFCDAAEKAIAKRKRLSTLVFKDDSTSTIGFLGSPWRMSFASVDNPEKLLKAIYYLNEKSWFTKYHLKALLILWQQTFGNGIDLTIFNAYPC